VSTLCQQKVGRVIRKARSCKTTCPKRDYTGKWTERSRLPTTSRLSRDNFRLPRSGIELFDALFVFGAYFY
jgi:hypothetical protein